MDVRDAVVAVTGAARGIGAALARRFAAEGARGVVVSDVNAADAEEVARGIREAGGQAVSVRADVGVQSEVNDIVAVAEKEFGPVDLFCSNAGVAAGTGLESTPRQWTRAWKVNVMAHVYAAEAVIPGMVARGGGYLLNTASAAGLLLGPGDAPYGVTKAGAVAFAEWLAVTYRPDNVRVSVLCPLGVRTDMLMPGIESGHRSAQIVAASGEILEPDDVAEIALRGVRDERFLILPHPHVHQAMTEKVNDIDGWLARVSERGGMI